MPIIPGRNAVINMVVETISPIHVGSGENLLFLEDYLDRDGQLFVVDRENTLRGLADGSQNLSKILTGTLQDWEAVVGQLAGYGIPWFFRHAGAPPAMVREFLKDAFFKPYIPGSSLKGAIRTALLAETCRDPAQLQAIKGLLPTGDRPPGPKFAAQRLEQHFFGGNPNSNLWRTIKVGDCHFPMGSLQAVDIRCLNLTRNGLEWRNLSDTPRNVRSWQNAAGWVVEALPPGKIGQLSWQVDGFLLVNRSLWQPGINLTIPNSFETWRQLLNNHASHRLAREEQFFQEIGYDAGRRQIALLRQQMVQQPDAAYLQLAWGSGWRGMTGDWLSPEDFATMRKLYGLGTPGLQFPKTRRLAVQDTPALPLGWLRLWPGSHAQSLLATQNAQSSPSMIWLNDTVAQLAKKNNSQDEVILRGNPLLNAIASMDDKNLQTGVIELIRSKWHGKGWWDHPPSGGAAAIKSKYVEMLDSGR